MKSLKTILGFIYPILIILLLLNNCNGCNREETSSPSPPPSIPPTDSIQTPPVPESDDVEIDTTATEVVRQAESIGSTGALKVTLLWNFHADIDLHVKQPNGKVIYYKDKKDTATGGYLDVDNREGGNGAAENIFWNEPPTGQYMVALNYYGKSQSGKAESGTCTIVVFQEGREPAAYNVNMSTLKEFRNIVLINIE
jgi:hypothetical protein